MSKDLRTQRRQAPKPSRWLLLLKVVVAIGQVISFVNNLFRD